MRRWIRRTLGARTPKFIGGGTNLLDLVKLQIEAPETLIDINHIGLDTIKDTSDEGGLRIGALVSNTALASDLRVRTRNMRCYRAPSSPAPRRSCATWRASAAICCNGRAVPLFLRHQPALQQTQSRQRLLRARTAIRASSRRSAAATNASRPIPAIWRWRCARSTRWWKCSGADGARAVFRLADFHRLPGDKPEVDVNLKRGELITAVTLPKPVTGKQFLSQGARPRVLFAFALGVCRSDHDRRMAPPASPLAALPRNHGATRRPTSRAEPRRESLPLLRCWQRRDADRGEPFQANPGRAHARRCPQRRARLTMLFDHPAGRQRRSTTNASSVNRRVRIDGPLKVSGRARYAYERQDAGKDVVYGYVVASASTHGLDRGDRPQRGAENAPGFVAAVTHENAGLQGQGQVQHRAAAGGAERSIITTKPLPWWCARRSNRRGKQPRRCASRTKIAVGGFDLRRTYDEHDGEAKPRAKPAPATPMSATSKAAFDAAPVKLDETYTTPDQSPSR